MADLKSSPWALYPNDVGLVIKDDRTFVAQFVWSDYVNTEDKCIIQDVDGREVFRARGTLDFEAIVFTPGSIPFVGLTLAKLDSGVLMIYIS